MGVKGYGLGVKGLGVKWLGVKGVGGYTIHRDTLTGPS
jgi:hypothetical protein